MSDCGCPGEDYSGSCCCASVTLLRGGIHPDYIKTTHVDLYVDTPGTRTFNAAPLTGDPIHIISATASLMCIKRSTSTSAANMLKQVEEFTSSYLVPVTRESNPVGFSLFTQKQWSASDEDLGGWNPHADSVEGRDYIVTGALTTHAPSWQSPPDLFGHFCDGGVYAEINAPSEQYGIRIVVNYVDRLAFSPAYADPVSVLQHYWKCSHSTNEEEFLEGFYNGVSFERFPGSGGSGTSTLSSGSVDSEVDTNPFSTEEEG